MGNKSSECDTYHITHQVLLHLKYEVALHVSSVGHIFCLETNLHTYNSPVYFPQEILVSLSCPVNILVQKHLVKAISCL